MSNSPWNHCLSSLRSQLSDQEFNTWIRPLQAIEDGNSLRLLAPNRFIVSWIDKNWLNYIRETVCTVSPDTLVKLEIGLNDDSLNAPEHTGKVTSSDTGPRLNSQLNANYTFEHFVEGKSNQLARAAALQVAQNPGLSYNPLFIAGGSGLGKTHLMNSIGNAIKAQNPNGKVAYVRSEDFVQNMVSALQHNKINEFKKTYRSLDALLIDDIQFFAGKERSQEEFFHTFNALLDGQKQVVLACDRYPKEVKGLEERLKSRFSWGLTVAIDTPELETSVAILMSKAATQNIQLPEEVAFFVAERFRSNVRDLEGALQRLIANSSFTGEAITLAFTKDALQDLLIVQERLVTIDNIQQTVVEYFNIRMADLLGRSRSRSIARPRQIGMALCKDLTRHSLPEIGDRFGGRDHTTVLHGCRKISELKETDLRVSEDYKNLLRKLTT